MEVKRLNICICNSDICIVGQDTVDMFQSSPCDSQRLRPTIHEIITAKIKAHAEHVNSSRPGIGQAARTATTGLNCLKGPLDSYKFPKQKRQDGTLLAGTVLAVSPVSPVMIPMGTAQAAAKELLDSILDTIVRIFGQIP